MNESSIGYQFYVTTFIIGYGIALAIRAILNSNKSNKEVLNKKITTVIFFGSGGHTTEMIELIRNLNVDKYSPMHFVISHVSQYYYNVLSVLVFS